MSQDNSNNNRIYDKLDKLDEKMDKRFEKLDTRLDSAERELAVYNEQLKYHIEGVRQVRTQNDLLKDYIDVENKKIKKEIEPIVEHVVGLKNTFKNIKNAAKWIGYVAAASDIIYRIILKIIEKV